MKTQFQKIYLWAVTVITVLAIYLLYVQLTGTQRIVIDQGSGIIAEPVESARSDEIIGMIDDQIGIGTVEVARFCNYRPDKSISREFGFDSLIHRKGNEWELARPFINVYERGFKCKITADKGQATVEPSHDGPVLKNETLSGNVVVHILPDKTSEMSESFIYFDYVEFSSDKASLWTEGPVRFVSDQAQMRGRGLRFMYNDTSGRIELFEITDMYKLELKVLVKDNNPRGSSLMSSNDSDYLLAGHTNKAPVEEKSIGEANGKLRKFELSKYRCIFRDNVRIETNDYTAMAESLVIDNILFRSQENGKNAIVKSSHAGDENKDFDRGTRGEAGINSSTRNNGDFTSSETLAGHRQEDGLVAFITVTCAGGLELGPVDSPRMRIDVSNNVLTDRTRQGFIRGFYNSSRSAGVIGDIISYDISSEQVTAAGKSQLLFYADSFGGSGEPAPMAITADDRIIYDSRRGVVDFEGNCEFVVIAEAGDTNERYTLNASKLQVLLSRGGPGVGGYNRGVREVLAQDNVVIKVTIGTDNKTRATFTAQQIRYEPARQMVLAKSPSKLKIYPEQGDNVEDSAVIITAQDSVTYSMGLNRAVFTGDCELETTSASGNDPRRFWMFAPKMEFELSDSKGQRQGEKLFAGINNMTASGSVVLSSSSVSGVGGAGTFFAETINYWADKNVILATGPCDLELYPGNDSSAVAGIDTSVSQAVSTPGTKTEPVRISVSGSARFLPLSNEVIFEGNCRSRFYESKDAGTRMYEVDSQKLVVVFDEQNADIESTMSGAIKSISAVGMSTLFVTDKQSGKVEAQLEAGGIEYSSADEKVTAIGPIDLEFPITGGLLESGTIPLKVTAKKTLVYSAVQNIAIFQGDCRCEIIKTDNEFKVNYALSSEKLSVLLAGDNRENTSRTQSKGVTGYDQFNGIKRIVADGEVVRLETVRRAGQKIISGVELKCRQFSYDGEKKIVLASGPGVIKLDNSQLDDNGSKVTIAQSRDLMSLAKPEVIDNSAGYAANRYRNIRRPTNPGKLSLGKKCFAFVRDFDTMIYNLNSRRIIADSKGGDMLMCYFPLVENSYDQNAKITAKRMEIKLAENPMGKMDIERMAASGGTTYEDGNNHLVCNELFYNAGTSTIMAQGSDQTPCMLNNAVVDFVEYDLGNGRVKSRISGPSAFRLQK